MRAAADDDADAFAEQLLRPGYTGALATEQTDVCASM